MSREATIRLGQGKGDTGGEGVGRSECEGVLPAGLSITLDTLGRSQDEDAVLCLLLCKSRTLVILCLDVEKQELFW